MGSWDTDTVYAIDPQSWSVTAEFAAPGRPYGIAAFGADLWVVVSLGEDDDRYLYRFDPQRGFDTDSKVACPDFTGSHLAANGSTLYLCQQGKQRILVLGPNASVQREIALPIRCAGFGFDTKGDCYMIAADEEFEHLEFARLNVSESTPAAEPFANVPFDVRALAFDGTQWWTSQREDGEIVAFTA